MRYVWGRSSPSFRSSLYIDSDWIEDSDVDSNIETFKVAIVSV